MLSVSRRRNDPVKDWIRLPRLRPAGCTARRGFGPLIERTPPLSAAAVLFPAQALLEAFQQDFDPTFRVYFLRLFELLAGVVFPLKRKEGVVVVLLALLGQI